MTEEQLSLALTECHDALREVRERRPRPHLDYKVIVAWNGMMISGLANASRALGVEGVEYLRLAERAFAFIATHMRNADGSLMRNGYVDKDGAFSAAYVVALLLTRRKRVADTFQRCQLAARLC